MKNNSHLTAISRNEYPSPVKWLLQKHLIRPTDSVLDYGCGKCFCINPSNWDSYDPYYKPNGITKLSYDIIICNYVLNVIEDSNDRDGVIDDIFNKLSDFGVAYITVRNDLKKLNGYTNKKTWQGLVVLPDKYNPVIVKKTSGYIIYSITKGVKNVI